MNDVRIRAEHAGMRVEATVDPATHRVKDLVGSVEPPALQAALSDASIGRTVQDVSEHAAIRAESLSRGSGSRPVAGVVQPENAGPHYGALVPLVRGLLKDYIAKTGYQVSMNADEGPVLRVSSEWGTSTVSERLQKILAAIPATSAETDIRGAEVKVKEIAGPRLTVELPASTPKAAQQKYLTLLELELRARVDPRIEVFLDDKRDANAKRHATEEALGI